MLLSFVSWLILLSPCFLLLSNHPASRSCLLSTSSSSCPYAYCFMLCSCLLSPGSASCHRTSYIKLLSPDPATRSCLLLHGAHVYRLLSLTLSSNLFCLLPDSFSDPAPCSCLLPLAPLSFFLPHCSFYMILSEGPVSWLCLLSPASHLTVLSTCSTSRVYCTLAIPPMHVVSPQSTYIDRDETG